VIFNREWDSSLGVRLPIVAPLPDLLWGHLDPKARDLFIELLAAMRADKMPITPTEMFRFPQRQLYLFAKGRVLPGARVTNCDGYKLLSNHQGTGEPGTGRAVDFIFTKPGLATARIPRYYPPTGNTPETDAIEWVTLGKRAKELGLEWGGYWRDKGGRWTPDRPHVELPKVPDGDAG